MSGYYSAPPQPPYPTQNTPYMPQQSYPQDRPHYPEQRDYQQARWNTPPPSQQPRYDSPVQPQQQQWDPQKIWAEANSPQPQHSGPATSSRSGSPFVGAPGQQVGPDGERGIGATVLGGGAGAFLGHEMGHSKLATVGGILAGAIAANAFEHHEKKKHHEREETQAYDQGFFNGEKRDLSGSRSRGIDDESYYERDATYDDDYAPHHHHHHHHHRDYDDDDYREDSYYRRDDNDDYRRGGDDYYERDSYVQRDDYRRRDDY